jgi:hypothetical protein
MATARGAEGEAEKLEMPEKKTTLLNREGRGCEGDRRLHTRVIIICHT